MRSWYMDVFRELSEHNVRFVVVGGIAVNLLGVPRFTADLDLVVALEDANVILFGQCMTRLGLKPKVPVPPEAFANPDNRKRWIAEKNMRVFSFQHPDRLYEVVDVFVNEPIPFAEMWSAKETISLENREIYVASIDHIIQLKREAMRQQDVSDIEALERLKEELKA
jgi:predicted nucleotidyltransferase